ncbi:protein JINGUBANG [Ananas comosus]|uniref:Protein JINGUBANG n=1 Tax=Ananas comosus TaxID=4615 RepID=A0A6P5HIY7_ANACO|nr:protein JINGUBANG [Ananas comosus]
MPLPRACLPFSAPSAAAKRADAIAELAADPSSSLRSLPLAASDDDDSASLLTCPSLPSLRSSLIPSSCSSCSPSSASFAYLTSLRPAVGPSSSASASASASAVSAAAALASSPASLLLYCATPSEICIYDLRGLRPIQTVAASPSAGALKSVALLPDGRRALTAHQDGRVRVWRRSGRSGRLRLAAALPTVPDRVRRLPLPGSYVRVRRHRRRLWIEHADAVSAVAAAAAGDLLYSSSWDKTLKIWRAADLRCVESLAAHDDAVNAVAVAPDGEVFTGSADGSIRVWARGERRHALVATLERHASAVNALAIGGGGGDEAGAVLYSGSNDRSILVWEKEGGRMAAVGALRGHEKAVLCVACVGNVVFSGSADRTVRIWRRGGSEHGCLGVLIGHSSAVRSITAVRTPPPEEEYRVCSASLDGEVRVWRVRVSALDWGIPSDPTLPRKV